MVSIALLKLIFEFITFFRVLRSRGTFGNVTVNWEILSSGRTVLSDNSEFVKAKGGLVFQQGSTRQILSVVVRNDGVPELNETFYLNLTNVVGRCACKFTLNIDAFLFSRERKLLVLKISH